MESNTKHQYTIRYWFEWGSTCFWSADKITREYLGYGIEPEQLPLASATVQYAHKLIHWHDMALNWAYPPDP